MSGYAETEGGVAVYVQRSHGGPWKRLDRPSVLVRPLGLNTVAEVIALFRELEENPSRLLGGGPIRGAVAVKVVAYDWWLDPLRTRGNADRAARLAKAAERRRKARERRTRTRTQTKKKAA